MTIPFEGFTPRLQNLGWLSPRDRLGVGELAATGHAAVSLAAMETLGWSGTDGRSKRPPSIFTYRQLLPSGLGLWCQGFRWGLKASPQGCNVVAISWPDGINEIASVKLMSRAQLREWLQAELDRLPISPRHFAGMMAHPEKLVMKGYALIRWARLRHVLNLHWLAVCLAMIGLGSRFLFNGRRCSVCFRWAEPGLDRCRYHSQSKLNLEESARSRAARSHAARVARRVLNQLNVQSATTGSGIFCVAGILWPAQSDRAWDTREALPGAIAQAPTVSSQLPADFNVLPYRQQLRLLRAAVDPNDWAATFWDRKVDVAQRWMSSEAAVAPGRAGPSELNQKRLAVAFKLLASGLSHSETAERLAVSRSHLSKLLGRHGHLSAS